ncbi:MAG: hypothetical protein D6720_00495 [Gammaproteobacteria bacterium]|nr:MAG: hypothetical protein D6720_00495 [Gammaproteobacteria bacterium]
MQRLRCLHLGLPPWSAAHGGVRMSEYNVCGVLVMARPERSPEVERALLELPGVEVHARGDDGKLVVTVEGPVSARCADTITEMALIDGVISASMVYHEIDPEPEEPGYQQEQAQ